MQTLSKFELSYTQTDLNGKTVAIIAAAGNATRMNGVDKQFLKLGDMPVLAKSITIFEKCDFVDSIVIVTRSDSVLGVQKMCDEYAFGKVTDIVAGGSNRAESVINGVKAAGDDAEILLIHDGARPLVEVDTVKAVYDAAVLYGAAICAVPVNDTVKQVNAAGAVVATPDRSTLRAVQTPQGFSAKLYREAIESFTGDLAAVTDDSVLVELCGKTVYTVGGSFENIKITTAADIGVAEKILENRGELL